VTVHTEIDPGLGAISRPPRDIASDAERVAYWRQLQAEQWRGRRVFEVSACGLHQFLACRPLQADGRTYINRPDCIQVSVPGTR
jgi:hypothetical protein